MNQQLDCKQGNASLSALACMYYKDIDDCKGSSSKLRQRRHPDKQHNAAPQTPVLSLPLSSVFSLRVSEETVVALSMIRFVLHRYIVCTQLRVDLHYHSAIIQTLLKAVTYNMRYKPGCSCSSHDSFFSTFLQKPSKSKHYFI